MEAKKIFEEEKKKATLKYSHQTKCKNATGDYMFNCHDTICGFDVENSKNCKYLYDAELPIDSYDLNNSYYNPELCLDLMGVLKTYNCKHCVYVFYASDLEYCDSLENCDSCFGCVGLKKKKYCILNKEYKKEEYEKLKAEIIENMKKEGVYGDFFPPELSPFGYNETLTQTYFPMRKEEAKAKGFNWQEINSGTYGKETIKKGEVPSSIENVDDEILKEILVCEDCDRNYRITKAELDFYKRMNIPLPHKDFECRHKDRMAKRNPRKLWSRSCMCEIDKHSHGEAKCEKEFETAYSPDRAEKVFCETCYQQEVY
jgi:hypothetical protein